jgi:hypothetical protein
MTTMAAADAFVSLRRNFFIEVILFPAAIFWLVTVAHASEQGREGRFITESRSAASPSNARLANSAASYGPQNCTRAFLQRSISPEALTRQYAEEALR